MTIRTFFVILILAGSAFYVYGWPRQAKEMWARLNTTVTTGLGVTSKAEYSPPKAYFVNTDLLIKSFQPKGVLVLTDSSKWLVMDEQTISTWSIGYTLRVEPAKNSQFPYLLINPETNSQVNAKFLGSE